jgi:hypothetical protein
MDRNGDFLHFFDLRKGLAGSTFVISTVFHRGLGDRQSVHQFDGWDFDFLQLRDAFAFLQQRRRKLTFKKLSPQSEPYGKQWPLTSKHVST